jgi:hypothetical protein
MKTRDTSEMCDALDQLLEDFVAGKITNSHARIHLGVLRTKLEVKKVEIAACALGKMLAPVSFVSKRTLREIEQKAA